MNDSQWIFALATLLGALGMWLMLPRGNRPGRTTGVVLAAAALGLWASRLPGLGDGVKNSLFFILAGATVVAAIATVTLRNSIYSTIWFGIALLGTAGLFLFAGARFLAVATVVVYAGAILVTFLFVLTPAQPGGRARYDRLSWEALVSAATGIVLAGVLSITVAHVGAELLGRHLIAVQVALLHNYLIVGALLFGIGMIGFLSRRNMIVIFFSAQMMLQAVSLSLVAFSRFHNDFGGRMLMLFIIAVAACQAAIALPLILTLSQRSGTLDIAAWHELREANQPPFEDEEIP